jgi:hypothetical protein
MGAIFSSFAALLNSGDHVLSSRAVFGSTHTLFTKIFPKWNIETTYFDATDLDALYDLVTPKTKILYVESPTNPGLQIIDLEFLGKFPAPINQIFPQFVSITFEPWRKPLHARSTKRHDFVWNIDCVLIGGVSLIKFIRLTAKQEACAKNNKQ